MNLIRKIIDFLKKIGVIQVEKHAGTYKSAKDENYRVEMPAEE